MCCKECCRLYVEPRLDGIRRDGIKILSEFSNQNVGYEPLRMEIGVRKQLLAMWLEDQQYRESVMGGGDVERIQTIGGESFYDAGEGGSESGSTLSNKSIEMGKMGRSGSVERGRSNKYFVKKQKTVRMHLRRDMEDEIGVDEGGGDEKEQEVIEEVAEELEHRADALLKVTTPRSPMKKVTRTRMPSLTEQLQNFKG